MTQPLRFVVRRQPAADAIHVSLRVPSAVECIEEAVELVVRHCLAGAEASANARFRLRVALSEALANAVIRGNGEDVRKCVLVRAELTDEQICLHVTDEGDGFDAQAAPDAPCPEVHETSGRGLFLIRHLVDDVRFNARGNSICMTLRRRADGSTTSWAASPG